MNRKALLLIATVAVALLASGYRPAPINNYDEAPLYAPVPLNNDEMALGERSVKMLIVDGENQKPVIQITQGFSIAPTEPQKGPVRLALPIVCTLEELRHMEPPVLTLDGAAAEYKLYYVGTMAKLLGEEEWVTTSSSFYNDGPPILKAEDLIYGIRGPFTDWASLCAEAAVELGESDIYTICLESNDTYRDPYLEAQYSFKLAVLTLVWDVEYMANESCYMEISYKRSLDYLAKTHWYNGMVRVQPEIDEICGPGGIQVDMQFQNLPADSVVSDNNIYIYDNMGDKDARELPFVSDGGMAYRLHLEQKPHGQLIFWPEWYQPQPVQKSGLTLAQLLIPPPALGPGVSSVLYPSMLVQIVGVLVCALVLTAEARRHNK